jgi:hypothetical protein
LTPSERIFAVDHEYPLNADYPDEMKFIGIFSTRELADAAIVRARRLPGFAEHPDDFRVTEFVVDEP